MNGGAFLLASLALGLNGCSQPTATISSPFVASDYSKYSAKGPNRVEGQAFLRQSGGSIVTCAGTPVLLLPDTAYVREGIEIGKAGKKLDLGDHAREISRLGASHKTICDAQGNFEF